MPEAKVFSHWVQLNLLIFLEISDFRAPTIFGFGFILEEILFADDRQTDCASELWYVEYSELALLSDRGYSSGGGESDYFSDSGYFTDWGYFTE